MRAAALGLALLVLAAVLASTPGARAAVPGAGQIRRAVAAHGRAAGRVRTLRLEVALRFGGSETPVATGTLVTDPGGSARLELRSNAGFVERHLLRGGRYLASRDGTPLAVPRPFLPPLYLLQARSGDVLARWLLALGARPGRVDLGYEGDHDCWVLGGRGDVALWVDQETRDVVRIDRSDGVRYRLGPVPAAGGIALPAWIEIDEPGGRTARLEVRSAEPVRATPADFAREWLAAGGP